MVMINTERLNILFAVLRQSVKTFKEFEKQQIDGENVSCVEAFHSVHDKIIQAICKRTMSKMYCDVI